MNAYKAVGVLLIALGVIGLAIGSFTYTEKHDADLGPIEISVKDKERVGIPRWAGIVAIAAGAGLLLVGSRRKG